MNKSTRVNIENKLDITVEKLEKVESPVAWIATGGVALTGIIMGIKIILT